MRPSIRTEVFTTADRSRWRLAEAIRQRVFVEEQACPPEEEWDEHDAEARHLLAWVEGKGLGVGGLGLGEGSEAVAVGTARWRVVGDATAKLERFAVVPEARGCGVGAALVAATLADARAHGCSTFVLHAQVQASGLYRRFGFVADEGIFVEAGIEHVRMWLREEGTEGVGIRDPGSGIREDWYRVPGTGYQRPAEPNELPRALVFYDGHCPLCHGAVRFLLARDRAEHFHFAPLQGPTAERVLGEAAADSDTVVLVRDPEGSAKRFERAAAVAEMLRDLPRPWPWVGAMLRALPRWLADWGYRQVARRRTLLGRYDTCPLPAPEHRARFRP
jgi:predicted DCC family thiol-disulfide oxidoreductase YuxK/predicted GNAT family N-acyltransferase